MIVIVLSIFVSKCDHIHENLQKRVLDVINDTLLMFIDGNVESLVQERNILRVGFSQLLYLEKLYKEKKG